MTSACRQSEAAIQRAVFQHLRTRAVPGVFAFHVPNGGYRIAEGINRAIACLEAWGLLVGRRQ
jgi:hypothetical protein